MTPPRRPPLPFDTTYGYTYYQPWPTWLRILVMLPFFLAAIAATWWVTRYVYPAPPSVVLPIATTEAKDCEEVQDKALNEEIAKLRQRNAALESELSMREGSQTTLVMHTETLEQENTQLKEELAYLKKLVAVPTRKSNITVQNLRIERQPNRTYSYQILLTQNNSNRNFEGTVKMLASDSDAPNAPAVTLAAIPSKGKHGRPDADKQLSVKFKYHLRLEGTVQIPEDVKAQLLTVQIIPNGASTPVATRSIRLNPH